SGNATSGRGRSLTSRGGFQLAGGGVPLAGGGVPLKGGGLYLAGGGVPPAGRGVPLGVGCSFLQLRYEVGAGAPSPLFHPPPIGERRRASVSTCRETLLLQPRSQEEHQDRHDARGHEEIDGDRRGVGAPGLAVELGAAPLALDVGQQRRPESATPPCELDLLDTGAPALRAVEEIGHGNAVSPHGHTPSRGIPASKEKEK